MASLNQVMPGRYGASIREWGINEVERLDGALEAWIKFYFVDQAGQDQMIIWKSLIMTKSGERNKKCISTIEACGLEGADMVKFMDDDALNTDTTVDITIVDQPSKDGSKIYKTVEWVNRQGDSMGNGSAKVTGDAKLSMQQKLIAMGLGKPSAKKVVKNYADDAVGAAGKELGF